MRKVNVNGKKKQRQTTSKESVKVIYLVQGGKDCNEW